MSGEDETELWKRFTRDIKPIKRAPVSKPEKDKKKPAKKSAVPTRPPERIVITPGLKAIETVPTEARQLDKRTDTKLRKGKMTIDATLDLHGMTQARAQDALHHFIVSAQKSGKRCVLVITGKGNSKKTSEAWLEQKPGILKQRLPQWLEMAPLNRLVLRHYPAQAEHGGGGAFYIYLKRER